MLFAHKSKLTTNMYTWILAYVCGTCMYRGGSLKSSLLFFEKKGKEKKDSTFSNVHFFKKIHSAVLVGIITVLFFCFFHHSFCLKRQNLSLY